MAPPLIAALLLSLGSDAAECPRCGWSPPATPHRVRVRSIEELHAAIARARPGTTILLADGTYRLDRSVDLTVPDLVLRGASGDRSRVVLRGPGMDERQIGSALSVSASGVVLADLSVGLVGFHGVQVRGERTADRVVMHNLRVVDTGQQLVKGSMGADGRGPNDGLLACSTLEYTNSAPGTYTNGVDVLGGRGWLVRDNRFHRVRGPEAEGWEAGPTILFWGGSSDTVVERNLVLDCYRGIALGLGPRNADPFHDHRGGIVRRNAVCNLGGWSDEPIEINACPGARVERNTVLVEGKVPWSIKARFPGTTATVAANLTNHEITAQDDAQVDQDGNLTNARREWFVDPAGGDLRLVRDDLPPAAAGVGAFGPRRDAARPSESRP